ncbi:MAG: UDP-N-acetylmuramoyl-tripeptide--D-alanyl-D-alanine ligase [Gemmatimonadales bacterium]
MTRWTASRVANALALPTPDAATAFAGIGTDTRTLEPGALFVALTGERFDGHAFVGEAIAKGAAGVVVKRGSGVGRAGGGGQVAVFEVDDSLRALGRLARERRREIDGPVVGVTGTNGKTATKEMLAAVVGTAWRTHATRENLNNLVGVPLTILDAPDDVEALVVEAGANVPGEIAALRAVIEPTVAVVTNVAAGHLEGFGSLEQVLEEKAALLDGVPAAVVGTTPPALAERARTLASRVLTAGTAEHADVRPERWSLDADGHGTILFGGARVRLPLVGAHQIENAVIALACGQVLGLDAAATVPALAAVALPPGRMELRRIGTRVVLHDAYNANPASLAAALETARALAGKRPLVVLLGSMLELGDESERLHAEAADRVVALDPALVGAVGAFVPAFEGYRSRLGDRLLTADDPATLGARVHPRLDAHAFVLVKASRGVRMERVLPHLESE